MNEIKVISILGCGWLGLPLAERLVRQGYQVNGATTTAAKLELLQQKGIRPYLIDLQDEKLDLERLAWFLQAQVLVLTIPPRLRTDNGQAYLRQLRQLKAALKHAPVSRLLFISSTAVYPDLNRTVVESDSQLLETLAPQQALLQAEELFLHTNSRWLTTVVRFGGLVGPDRHPGRFMAGKTQVPQGDAPVNMIHLDDCVEIVCRVIGQGHWGKIYNACADGHPIRKHFYTKAAQALGLTPPEFEDKQQACFKLVSSEKLKKDLSYMFLYPDPMHFF